MSTRRPSTPKWAVMGGAPGTSGGSAPPSKLVLSHEAPPPPPPPDSPSGHSGRSTPSSSSGGDLDGESFEELAAAAQAAQKESLRREFLALAREGGGSSAGGVAESEVRLNLDQFQRLLKGHLRAHAAAEASISPSSQPPPPQDDAELAAQLAAMWAELPKSTIVGSGGVEGVSFEALFSLLSGENDTASIEPTPDPSPLASRRASLAYDSGRTSGADPLFRMFARRPSVGRGSIFAAAARVKSHSESGGRGSMPPPPPLPPPTEFTDRPRAKTTTLPPKEDATEDLDFPVAIDTEPSSPILRSPRALPASAASANGINLSPIAASSSPTASGALDLDDPDWFDLSWLVTAHPAAFSAAATAALSPRGSFSFGSPISSSPSSTTTTTSAYVSASPLASSSPVDPSSAPQTTLVSPSALQIAMQHYLGRWLNNHEIGVIATMHRCSPTAVTPPTPAKPFGSPMSSPHHRSTISTSSSPAATAAAAASAAVQAAPDALLTFASLQRTVASLHALLRANVASPLVDPLPAFACGLGLLSTPTSLPTDDLLDHLRLFESVLGAVELRALFGALGGGVMQSTSLLKLVESQRDLRHSHARLEKEHSLLAASRENLDSSHADLADQVPFLESRVEELLKDQRRMKEELAKAQELAASASQHRTAHERAQRRLQEVQEDHAALQSEFKVGKESHVATEEELAATSLKLQRAKDRTLATETALRDFEARASLKSSEDAAALARAGEEHQALEAKYKDLLERSQIFYRRLVAAGGDIDDLEPVEGVHPSTRRTIADHRRMTTYGGGGDALNDSLGAELSDSARNEAVHRVQAQAAEIASLQRQIAALHGRVADRDREIERSHATTGNGTTPLEVGPASDGEDPHQKKGLCAPCSIM